MFCLLHISLSCFLGLYIAESYLLLLYKRFVREVVRGVERVNELSKEKSQVGCELQ